jgi:hypothetical protein
MKLKTGLPLVLAAALLLGAGLAAADQAQVDLSKIPIGPMKFNGQVSIENRSSGQSVWVAIEVRKGGVLAPGGVLAVGGHPVPSKTGSYTKQLPGTSIHSGDPVPIFFTAPWPGLPTCSASLAAPQLIQVSAPREGSHVAPVAGGSLEIRWTGGTPPYRFDLKKTSSGASIVSLRDLPAGSASVPFASLTPGLDYVITISDALRFYVFAPAVDPDSHVYLRQIIWSHFFLD